MNLMRLLSATVTAVVFEQWGRPRLESWVEEYAERRFGPPLAAAEGQHGNGDAGSKGGTVSPRPRKQPRAKPALPPSAAKETPKRRGRPSKAEMEARTHNEEMRQRQLDALAKGRATRAKNLAAKRQEGS